MGDLRPDALGLLDLLGEGSMEAVALVTTDGRVSVAGGGRVVTQVLGRSAREVAEDPSGVIHPGDQAEFTRLLERVRARPGMSASCLLRAQHKAGHWVGLVVTATNRVDHPSIAALVLRARLDPSYDDAPSSSSSPISWRPDGVSTRADLVVTLNEALERKRRVPNRRNEFSLLLVELRDFRRIRTTLPKPQVEKLLSAVAKRMERFLDRSDTVAHVGDGSIGVVLRGVGDSRRAERMANRLLKALGEPFDIDGRPLSVTAVVGIAASEREYRDAEAVIRDAGSASNRATKRRRNVAAYRTSIRHDDQRRIETLADMHHALREDGFSLAYQPIVSLSDGRLLGFEALARWDHPSRGAIPPSVFIPLAEETGLIERLGDWVLKRACHDMAGWSRRYRRRELTVSVNVSGIQLGSAQLIGSVEEALSESKLPPEQLRLELTETTVLDDVDRAAAAIHQLRLYGLSFALDDFGTGYSSLSVLQRMEYEVLKIDRSFLGTSFDKNEKIVRAIVNLALGLSMTVVAEGVETKDQMRALTELGCQAAQGYLIAHPLPPEEAETLIASG